MREELGCSRSCELVTLACGCASPTATCNQEADWFWLPTHEWPNPSKFEADQPDTHLTRTALGTYSTQHIVQTQPHPSPELDSVP